MTPVQQSGESVQERLLPCPFCGHKELRAHRVADQAHPAFGLWVVACTSFDCHALSGWFDTEAEVIDAWNRRTPDIARLAARIEQVESSEAILETAAKIAGGYGYIGTASKLREIAHIRARAALGKEAG